MAKPLFQVVAWAAGSYLAALALHAAYGFGFEASLRAASLVAAGALYTNLFEYAWHRFAMHGGRPDPRHATHHRLFYGPKFQTRDVVALQEITTAWYVFPILLSLHYPLFAWLLLGPPLAPAFFFGVTLHYVVFEVTHWYIHVADNGFDRWLARIPGVRALRAAQIAHHRLHHAQATVNFNFTPPYAGDRLGGMLRR